MMMLATAKTSLETMDGKGSGEIDNALYRILFGSNW